ncbi:MAG: tail fiber domain-containing protein, partial [Alphaproteobacteria bacterium]
GQLGTMSSSRRFKKEVKPMNQASEAILSLKPVTFRYKSDKAGTPQFGLIAEEVAEVNPDLVVREKDGKIYTVRYDAVNAMLLNEFLKEHRAFLEEQRKVHEQEATIAELKSRVAKQESGIETLASQVQDQAAAIRKVATQLELTKPLLQKVADDR